MFDSSFTHNGFLPVVAPSFGDLILQKELGKSILVTGTQRKRNQC